MFGLICVYATLYAQFQRVLGGPFIGPIPLILSQNLKKKSPK